MVFSPIIMCSHAPGRVEPHRFPTSEHVFMHKKALLFGDQETADAIQKEVHPQRAKLLSRQVSPFDASTWENERQGLMLEVLRVKFADPELRAQLRDTQGCELAEASPSDHVWGIGMSEAEAKSGESWTGRNLLGVDHSKVLSGTKKERNQ